MSEHLVASTQYFNQSKFQDGFREINLQIQKNPHDSYLYSNRAVFLVELGNSSQAVKDLKTSIALNYLNYVSYFNLFSIHIRQNDLSHAVQDLHCALSAIYLVAAKQLKNYQYASRAVFYAKNNTAARVLKGLMQMEQGKFKQAHEQLVWACGIETENNVLAKVRDLIKKIGDSQEQVLNQEDQLPQKRRQIKKLESSFNYDGNIDLQAQIHQRLIQFDNIYRVLGSHEGVGTQKIINYHTNSKNNLVRSRLIMIGQKNSAEPAEMTSQQKVEQEIKAENAAVDDIKIQTKTIQVHYDTEIQPLQSGNSIETSNQRTQMIQQQTSQQITHNKVQNIIEVTQIQQVQGQKHEVDSPKQIQNIQEVTLDVQPVIVKQTDEINVQRVQLQSGNDISTQQFVHSQQNVNTQSNQELQQITQRLQQPLEPAKQLKSNNNQILIIQASHEIQTQQVFQEANNIVQDAKAQQIHVQMIQQTPKEELIQLEPVVVNKIQDKIEQTVPLKSGFVVQFHQNNIYDQPIQSNYPATDFSIQQDYTALKSAPPEQHPIQQTTVQLERTIQTAQIQKEIQQWIQKPIQDIPQKLQQAGKNNIPQQGFRQDLKLLEQNTILVSLIPEQTIQKIQTQQPIVSLQSAAQQTLNVENHQEQALSQIAQRNQIQVSQHHSSNIIDQIKQKMHSASESFFQSLQNGFIVNESKQIQKTDQEQKIGQYQSQPLTESKNIQIDNQQSDKKTQSEGFLNQILNMEVSGKIMQQVQKQIIVQQKHEEYVLQSRNEGKQSIEQKQQVALSNNIVQILQSAHQIQNHVEANSEPIQIHNLESQQKNSQGSTPQVQSIFPLIALQLKSQKIQQQQKQYQNLIGKLDQKVNQVQFILNQIQQTIHPEQKKAPNNQADHLQAQQSHGNGQKKHEENTNNQ